MDRTLKTGEKAFMSETEKAIIQQPGILALDWGARLSPTARAQASRATSVTFVGTGTSYHCALWAEWLCRSMGAAIPIRTVSTWDFLAGKLAAEATSRELFVVISHRGRKNLSERALTAIGRRRHILVTGQGAPVGKHPFIYTSPQEVSSAHTMSLVGAMGAASEIVALLLGPAKAKRLRAARMAAARLLNAAEKTLSVPTLGSVLSRATGLHFVGGGPFHAMALELALKAREIVHLAAHAYNTEEFLHGPLASVEEEDTLVLLPPLKAPAGAAAAYLYRQRIDACRKAAEAVGALVVEPRFERSVSAAASRLDGCWQALLHLYWGQALCLASAKQWKINPDLNRRDDPRYEEARRRIEA